jgi:hypothetical protein
MKQFLFLLLFPCLCMAQYPGNAGQKITLGEQTSADGLVYRGLAADTTRKPSVDTMAYILLDTNTNIIWQYKKATSNAWTRVGGSISSGVTGVLPVENGGTGATALTANKFIIGNGTSPLTSISSWNYISATDELEFKTGIATFRGPFVKTTLVSDGMKFQNFSNAFLARDILSVQDSVGDDYYKIGFLANNQDLIYGYIGTAYNDTWLQFDINGNVGVKIDGGTPTEALHVVGNARITAMNGIGDIGASATGVLQAATSDMNLKNTIENSPFGLNEILLLNPVTFLYNDENRKIDSDVKEVGFIAQDVFDIIPNAVSSTGTGDLQLDYRAITATLTKAIQEQQALIKALEQRILILENK